MSDPTYRIDVEHTPSEAWLCRATVIRLSDDAIVFVKLGETVEDVLHRAQEAVASLSTQQPTFSLFVDDDGQRVEAHSVKAS